MGLEELIAADLLPADVLPRLEFWCHPLAEALIQDAGDLTRPLMVAVSGPPAASKALFTDFLVMKLNEMGFPAIHFRVADFRLSHHARERVAQSVHPLMMYPGLPGTHDTRELERVLTTLRKGELAQPLHIPVFDKAYDVRASFSRWRVLREMPRIVLVSGWTLGVMAQDASSLQQPVNAMEAELDADMTWRRAVNRLVSDEYQPLYGYFDRWVFRKPPDFASVARWIAEDQSQWLKTMEERELEVSEQQRDFASTFTQLCQRLVTELVDVMPTKSDYLLTLNSNRRITSFARQRVS